MRSDSLGSSVHCWLLSSEVFGGNLTQKHLFTQLATAEQHTPARQLLRMNCFECLVGESWWNAIQLKGKSPLAHKHLTASKKENTEKTVLLSFSHCQFYFWAQSTHSVFCCFLLCNSSLFQNKNIQYFYIQSPPWVIIIDFQFSLISFFCYLPPCTNLSVYYTQL